MIPHAWWASLAGSFFFWLLRFKSCSARKPRSFLTTPPSVRPDNWGCTLGNLLPLLLFLLVTQSPSFQSHNPDISRSFLVGNNQLLVVFTLLN
ncbi:hypothetical protein DFH07DRAFT_804850 [Mycena maculata]|uniref:Secreted protein n=1 Tax=Mycena maculata TaxID=230809 RepID=A0AAD7JSU3_9AGAR|nr:hypothetical protein DFH07DRAFT_804850 [Mycena maculata]